MEGFKDIATGEARRGYIEIVKELGDKFPDTDNIVTEQDKKEFVKLFGEYLRVENILQNFDEFTTLKAFQTIDTVNFVTDDDIAKMQNLQIPSDRIIQDYKSTYNDIRDWLRREKEGKKPEKSRIDWDDVIFEIDFRDRFA